MNIAGVSVNEKSLPSKEILVQMALKTVKYYQLPRQKALSLIDEEIKKSGLYSTNKKRSTNKRKSNRKSSR